MGFGKFWKVIVIENANTGPGKFWKRGDFQNSRGKVLDFVWKNSKNIINWM